MANIAWCSVSIAKIPLFEVLLFCVVFQQSGSDHVTQEWSNSTCMMALSQCKWDIISPLLHPQHMCYACIPPFRRFNVAIATECSVITSSLPLKSLKTVYRHIHITYIYLNANLSVFYNWVTFEWSYQIYTQSARLLGCHKEIRNSFS